MPSTASWRLSISVAVLGAMFLLLLGAGPGTASPPYPEHACRFWAMVGEAPPDSAIYDQLVSGKYSFRRLGASNGNGWSLAYHAETLQATGLERPQILRGGPPSDHEYDLRYVEAVSEMLAMDANLAIAHVRAASSGHAGVPDPHPFYRDGLALAHNGTFLSTGLEMLLEEGTPGYLEKHPADYKYPYIDSELFTLLLLKTRDQGVDREGGMRSHAIADAIAATTLNVYDAGFLGTAANIVVAVGDTLCAMRFDNNNQARYKVRYRSVAGTWVVASEPVGTDTTGWKEIPPKSLAVFTAGQPVEIRTVFPPAGAWLSLEKTLIDDDQSGQSSGNGDGGLDAGEVVELYPALLNVGGTAATQISAELDVAEDLCVLLDSTAAYPDLPPGSQSGPYAPFVIEISPDIGAAHHQLNFTLTVTATRGGERATWTRPFILQVYSPEIRFFSHRIDDNEDGYLEPGEEADVWVWLLNDGSEMATSLVGNLASFSPHVTILEPESYLDTLDVYAVDSLTPPARILVDPACPDPHILNFIHEVEADWGIAERLPFDVPVGGFTDQMEGGSGAWAHQAGMPGYGDAWHLSSLENHTAGGQFAWKCGAPDSGAVYPEFLDAALITPELTLCTHTELHFWHWIRSQLYIGQYGRAVDGGLVEAAINGGPWQQIYPATGYDFLIQVEDSPGPFPQDTPVFSGWYLWREEVFVVDGHTGTVQFRFRFGSDGNPGGEGLEGWYIDDVRVLGTNQPSNVPEVIAISLRPALVVGGPSPFRDQTLLLYDVRRTGDVNLSIHDLEGRVVRHLVQGRRPAGRHRIMWDGLNNSGQPVASGLYFYRLNSRGDDFEEVRRIIRLR